jgi:hypothetical protein
LAYVFTISAFKSWKALIRTILKGMLRDRERERKKVTVLTCRR